MEAKGHVFDILLQAGGCFSISHVIVGEMFVSLGCLMYEDKEVLNE